MRQTAPSGVEICSPMPRTRDRRVGGIGVGGAEVEPPDRRILPAAKTCAFDSSAPLPLDSNMPVKQMPLAWLRRWPSAGPPAGANASTSLAGVRRSGENHPAV